MKIEFEHRVEPGLVKQRGNKTVADPVRDAECEPALQQAKSAANVNNVFGEETAIQRAASAAASMPRINRKSPEEKAAAAQVKQQEQETKRREKEHRQAAEKREKEHQAFLRTPAGQARQAFKRGDQVFQYSANVMSQQAIVVSMVGTRAPQKTADPSVILNSVCNEGWELVNGSFVFVETGQRSRDKFLASGQQVAISGATVGYYLFKRCEGNEREVGNPWEADEEPVLLDEESAPVDC